MLVNIYATLTHLSDAQFGGADRHTFASIDFLICEGLRRVTKDRQTWMINPVWTSPGTTGQLLRDSYTTIRDAPESYLLLITPGFADVVHHVPAQVVIGQLRELCRRGRMFNKRSITTLLGVPRGCPGAMAQQISDWNRVVLAVTEAAGGVVVDLRQIAYEPWDSEGSRPADLTEAAGPLVQGVLDSHCAAAEWQARYGA